MRNVEGQEVGGRGRSGVGRGNGRGDHRLSPAAAIGERARRRRGEADLLGRDDVGPVLGERELALGLGLLLLVEQVVDGVRRALHEDRRQQRDARERTEPVEARDHSGVRDCIKTLIEKRASELLSK